MNVTTDERAAADSLNGIIEAMQQLLAQLLVTLRQEAEILAAAGTPDIDACIERKHSLLQSMDELERSRRQTCLDQGLEAAPREMLDQLRAAPPRHKLVARWDGVLELLETCQQQNLTNGAILQLRRRFTMDALGVLRGSDSKGLYSASGDVDSYSARNAHYLSA